MHAIMDFSFLILRRDVELVRFRLGCRVFSFRVLPNMSTAKERHYQQLGAKLQAVSFELEETQRHFEELASHLESMNTLGAAHAAQFMAVSRLLDAEMAKAEEEAAVRAASDVPDEK